MISNDLNTNTMTYAMVLRELLDGKVPETKNGITNEMLNAAIDFDPEGHIYKTAEKYVQHELDWYDSMDLSIKGHPGIENNPIWKECATHNDELKVNSNYGWCVFSKENCNQFMHCVGQLIEDHDTKRAIMVYSRPSIVYDYCDGIHANRDMICTLYTNVMIRDNILHYFVRMRSNDAWFGLRNDLAWHQNVMHRVYSFLKTHDKSLKDLRLGPIHWMADSLHLYKDQQDIAFNYVEDVIDQYQKLKETDKVDFL